MDKILLLRVHLLDDRYHGVGDWPPAPARLFQALVAGNAVGARLPEPCAEALAWLESLPEPPEIRAQRGRPGLAYTSFVPNNDLDAVGGDPARIGEIRTAKTIQPRHLDPGRPIVYLWRFPDGEAENRAAARVCAMADNLYQLGRGIDMAWAAAEILGAESVAAVMDRLSGDVYRPGTGAAVGKVKLGTPAGGTLQGLLDQYRDKRGRFAYDRHSKKVSVRFANPARKPRFRTVSYNPAERWRLFDLRAAGDGSRFQPWPLHRAVALVEQVRDRIAARLGEALPDRAALVERIVVGRGAGEADKARRIRLIAIPSIGHRYAESSIRRLLLGVPGDCPLEPDDLEWGLSGLGLSCPDGAAALLVPSDDASMLRHYGLESRDAHRCWRSVTPLVLPVARRHRHGESAAGSVRADEEQRACATVIQALRHAGWRTAVDAIRVQREPFVPRELRAEAFADGPRFTRERLWHVEIRFRRPVEGPVLLGDGRYLGLGLMAHVSEYPGVWGYGIENEATATEHPEPIAAALRRAVMSRVQNRIGAGRRLPGFFTGHEPDGTPLRRGDHRHLAFAFDSARRQLYVIAPHRLEGRDPHADEQGHLATLEQALEGFAYLLAGPAGRLRLTRLSEAETGSELFGSAVCWESVTDYRPTRHNKRLAPVDALREDLRAEIARSGLPSPGIEVLSLREGPNGGLSARLRLCFPRRQDGPLLLGRNRHLGGGLFRAVPARESDLETVGS